VIVPTRDRPALLAAALASIGEQRLRPAEVIVVDDGLLGSAASVVGGRWGADGPDIRVLEGPRMGPAAARNAGLRAAEGSLIAFLDDDDVWLPGKLHRQIEWFLRRPSLGVLGTACLRSQNPDAASVFSSRRRRRLEMVSQSRLVRANRLATSSVVARRTCFEECGGFDESLPLAQDWDMWLRIAARWEIGLVPEPLTIHRVHDEQRSADRLAMRRWEASVVERTLRRGGLRGRWVRGVARRRVAWAHLRLGRLLARRGYRERALGEMRESLALAPYNPLTWLSLLRWGFARRMPVGAGP
jgi:glycosyltransferase involved in cell wall biosynthesis